MCDLNDSIYAQLQEFDDFLNSSLPDEYDRAEAVAEQLDCTVEEAADFLQRNPNYGR